MVLLVLHPAQSALTLTLPPIVALIALILPAIVVHAQVLPRVPAVVMGII